MAEESACGSSKMSGSLSTIPSMSASSQVSSTWSVPRCRATAAAWVDSSNSESRNRTVNVFTGVVACSCIMATMSEESTPPDRNAPSGTSGHEPLPHGERQAGFEFLEWVRVRRLSHCSDVIEWIPVPGDGHAALFVDKVVRRRQLLHVREDREWRRDIPVPQKEP